MTKNLPTRVNNMEIVNDVHSNDDSLLISCIDKVQSFFKTIDKDYLASCESEEARIHASLDSENVPEAIKEQLVSLLPQIQQNKNYQIAYSKKLASNCVLFLAAGFVGGFTGYKLSKYI